MIPLADAPTGKTGGGSAATQVATGGTVKYIFYLFDERGNTSLRIDASGNLLSAHLTDAYGQTVDWEYLTTMGSWAEDPFTGMGAQYGYYREAYLDSYRCGLRLYDVYSARWLTRDPIGYGGGQNLYGFVSGNPINFADPLGLDPTKLTSAQRTQLLNALELMRQNGLPKTADTLQRRVENGFLLFDPDLDKRNHAGETNGLTGQILLGSTAFDLDYSINKHSPAENLLADALLSSVLVHEAEHVCQGKDIFIGDPEYPAYTRQIEYLEILRASFDAKVRQNLPTPYG